MSTTLSAGRTWAPHEIAGAGTEDRDLAAHLTELGADRLTELLTEHKALVFRGFGVTPDSIESVLDRLLPNRLPYVHGNSPRPRVRGVHYTSTQ
jgi:hypothetical protein